MRRRDAILGLAALAAGPALAHTPYRQWVIYRRKHLILGSHRSDPETFRIAKALEAELAGTLPEARARVARAPRPERLASLLGTDQLDFVILEAETAEAMAAGTGPFSPYGEIPLRAQAMVEGRLLAAHARVPARHAALLAQALDKADPAGGRLEVGGVGLPAHPGLLDYLRGAESH